MIASYGMAVGAEVFATCVEIGRMVECQPAALLIPRARVKLALCGSARATDANLRQALLDRYGGSGSAIGIRKAPGPLYGVKSHAWAALALAWTVQLERAELERL